ncbi:MAG: LOG family protein [Planctomycetota bacterium]
MATRRRIIGVLGGMGDDERARAVGGAIAEAGCLLACGGGLGVMESAARGAREAGGDVIGILPGTDPEWANEYVNIPIATGLGEARNCVLATCSDAVVCLGSGPGTLSEVAFALKLGRPVYAIRSGWDGIPGVVVLADVGALRGVLSATRGGGGGGAE